MVGLAEVCRECQGKGGLLKEKNIRYACFRECSPPSSKHKYQSTCPPEPKVQLSQLGFETCPSGLDSSNTTCQKGRGEKSSVMLTSPCGLMWAKTALTYLTSPPAKGQRLVPQHKTRTGIAKMERDRERTEHLPYPLYLERISSFQVNWQFYL